MGVSGVALAAAAIGGVFVYGGIKGKSPLIAFQSVVTGNNPSGLTPTQTIHGNAGKDPLGPTLPITPHGGNNKAIGRLLAAQRGWTGPEWDALDKLWTRESGWSNTVTGSPTNLGRAYGIPQALPASKLPAAGQPPQSDPTTQIRWGLTYIAQRYGTPIKAWAHETTVGWY